MTGAEHADPATRFGDQLRRWRTIRLSELHLDAFLPADEATTRFLQRHAAVTQVGREGSSR